MTVRTPVHEKLRHYNVIIHGVKEKQSGDMQSDTDFMKGFFDVLGINAVKYENITRLGQPSPDKSRPIKVTMKRIEDKTLLFSRLPNLKNADEFRRIHVTEDYSVDERSAIRKKVEQAAKKNRYEKDESVVWKVRGTPKNGLRLVKFTKLTNQ